MCSGDYLKSQSLAGWEIPALLGKDLGRGWQPSWLEDQALSRSRNCPGQLARPAHQGSLEDSVQLQVQSQLKQCSKTEEGDNGLVLQPFPPQVGKMLNS